MDFDLDRPEDLTSFLQKTVAPVATAPKGAKSTPAKNAPVNCYTACVSFNLTNCSQANMLGEIVVLPSSNGLSLQMYHLENTGRSLCIDFPSKPSSFKLARLGDSDVCLVAIIQGQALLTTVRASRKEMQRLRSSLLSLPTDVVAFDCHYCKDGSELSILFTHAKGSSVVFISATEICGTMPMAVEVVPIDSALNEPMLTFNQSTVLLCDGLTGSYEVLRRGKDQSLKRVSFVEGNAGSKIHDVFKTPEEMRFIVQNGDHFVVASTGRSWEPVKMPIRGDFARFVGSETVVVFAGAERVLCGIRPFEIQKRFASSDTSTPRAVHFKDQSASCLSFFAVYHNGVKIEYLPCQSKAVPPTQTLSLDDFKVQLNECFVHFKEHIESFCHACTAIPLYSLASDVVLSSIEQTIRKSCSQ